MQLHIIYCFLQVKRFGNPAYYIDGREEVNSNWLRFVNCACDETQQNMVAFQYCGQIYYRTYRNVYPGDELMVWYGEEYARELGIEMNYDVDSDDEDNGEIIQVLPMTLM